MMPGSVVLRARELVRFALLLLLLGSSAACGVLELPDRGGRGDQLVSDADPQPSRRGPTRGTIDIETVDREGRPVEPDLLDVRPRHDEPMIPGGRAFLGERTLYYWPELLPGTYDVIAEHPKGVEIFCSALVIEAGEQARLEIEVPCV